MADVKIGQLCAKLAGRDAGEACLIIKQLDGNFVMVDGNVRRKKCNLAHLEFLPKAAEIKADASHEEVIAAMEKLGVPAKIKKQRTREKKAPAAPKAEAKKAEPKAAKAEKKPKAKRK